MIWTYNARTDDLFHMSNGYYAEYGIHINDLPHLTDLYIGY